MEDCPICKMIEEGKIIKEDNGCCLLAWQDEPILDKPSPVRKIVVMREHGLLLFKTHWQTATDLLQCVSGVLASFELIPGHEGVMMISSVNVGQGRSGASDGLSAT